MPLPCLPVLSATSCSTQRPNDCETLAARARASACRDPTLAPAPMSAPRARPGFSRDASTPAAPLHRARAASNDRDRAHQRGRHHPEERERRIAAADVRRVHEDVAESFRHRTPVKRGVLVGDRDESRGPSPCPAAITRRCASAAIDVRLDRGARFAGEDEQRFSARAIAARTASGSTESSTRNRGVRVGDARST